MLKAAGEASWDPLPPKEEFLLRLAGLDNPPAAAAKVVRAWDVFAQAFARYPCSSLVFYQGPIARCPIGTKLRND